MVLTATCTNRKCGRMFGVPKLAHLPNARNVTFSNNIVQCPYCGASAKVQEGTFDFDERGLIHVLSSKDLSRDVLVELQKVIQDAQRKKYSPDQFRAEAEKVDPAVKSIFLDPIFVSQWNMVTTGLQTLFAFLTVILAAVAIIISIKQGKDTPPVPPIHITIEQPKSQQSSETSAKLKKAKLKRQKKSHNSARRKKR